MKKISFILFVTLCCLLSCNNTKKRPSGNPSEILDVETYNKLQQSYDKILNYQQGTAIVLKKESYGLIDERGTEVLPCIYDSISSFLKHFRIIKKDDRYGVLNIDGEIIKQCIYSSFKTRENYMKNRLCDFLALKLNDKWGFIDSKGNDVTQYKYEDIICFNDSNFTAKYNGHCGVSDYQNNILIPFKYDEIDYKMDEKCPVTKVKLNERYGLYNSKNEEVLPCEYGVFYSNEYGYLTIQKFESENYKTKRKALVEAETGKIIIPFEYIDMGNYSEGLVACQKPNGQYGFLDLKGNVVVPFIYSDAGDFSEGLAPVYKQVGFMNTVLGKAPKNKCGYIDTKGNVVIPFIFQETYIASMNEFHEGLAVQGVSNNNKFGSLFGYIDKKGNWVIKPQYNDANNFKNGIASVAINNKYGYINKKGEAIIPCIYDKYGGYFVNDSTITIAKEGVDYYFNLQGKTVPKPE